MSGCDGAPEKGPAPGQHAGFASRAAARGCVNPARLLRGPQPRLVHLLPPKPWTLQVSTEMAQQAYRWSMLTAVCLAQRSLPISPSTPGANGKAAAPARDMNGLQHHALSVRPVGRSWGLLALISSQLSDTQAHACTHMYTCTHMHRLAHMCTHKCTSRHTCAHMISCLGTQVHPRTQLYTIVHICTDL